MAQSSNPVARDIRVAQFLRAWLAAGALACTLVPAWRGHDPVFGWLPFWLVVAPLIDLVWLRREPLLAAVRARLVRRPHRRRSLPQARRLRPVQSEMPSRFLSIRRRNSDMMRRYRSSPR